MSFTLALLCFALVAQISLIYPKKAPGDNFQSSPKQAGLAKGLAVFTAVSLVFALFAGARGDAKVVGTLVSLSLSGIVLSFCRPLGARWTFVLGGAAIVAAAALVACGEPWR